MLTAADPQAHPLATATSENRRDGFNRSRKLQFIERYKLNRCDPSKSCDEIGIGFITFWGHFNVNSGVYDPWFHKQIEAIQKEYAFHIQQTSFNLAELEKSSTFNDRIATLNGLLPEIYKPERLKLGIFVNQPGNLTVSYVNPTTNEIGNPLRRREMTSSAPNPIQSIANGPISDATQVKKDARSKDALSPQRREQLREHAKHMRETRQLKRQLRNGGGEGEG